MKKYFQFSCMAIFALLALLIVSCDKDEDLEGGGEENGSIVTTSQDEFKFELHVDHTAELLWWKNEIVLDDVIRDYKNSLPSVDDIGKDSRLPWNSFYSFLCYIFFCNNGEVPKIPEIELRDLVIPSQIQVNGETYTVTSIDDGAFSDVYNLRSIKLPNTIKKIKEDAFWQCVNLQKINIPASVSSISNETVFSGCVSLESIDVDPSNNTYCSQDGVLFSKNMKTIRYYPCGRKGAYSIPSSVETIGTTAFEGAIYLSNVVFHNNITTLGRSAFNFCLSLEDVKINEGVEIIRESFVDCYNLKRIDLPSTIKELGEVVPDGYGYHALDDCVNLENVIIRAFEPPIWYANSWNTNDIKPSLYVPKVSIQAYSNYFPPFDKYYYPYLYEFRQILPLED